MAEANYRVYSSRLIRPDAGSEGVKLKVVEQFTVRDPRRRYQDFTFTLRNSPNGKRTVKVVDVKDLSTSTTGDSLSVERIVKFNDKTPEENWWDSVSTFWSGRDPVIHKKTHTRKIYATDGNGVKNTDVWIKVRRTDQIHFVDPNNKSAQAIFYFKWPDLEDPEWDYTDVPEPIETWSFNDSGINPPWRLDPFQDIIDCSFGGTYLMALYNGNCVAALNFNKILEIIGASGYTGATGGYTGVTGVNVYSATGMASSWGTEKLKASVYKFGYTGPNGPTGAPPLFVMSPLGFSGPTISRKDKQQLTTIWTGTGMTGATAPTGATGPGVLENTLETSVQWFGWPLMISSDSEYIYTVADKFSFTGGFMKKDESWDYAEPVALKGEGKSYQFAQAWGIEDPAGGWLAYDTFTLFNNYAQDGYHLGQFAGSIPEIGDGDMWYALVEFNKGSTTVEASSSVTLNIGPNPGDGDSGNLSFSIPFQIFGQTGSKDALSNELVGGNGSLACIKDEVGFITTNYATTFEAYSYSGEFYEGPPYEVGRLMEIIKIPFPPSLGKETGKKFYAATHSDSYVSDLTRYVETPYGSFSKSGFSDLVATGATGAMFDYPIWNDFRGWLHLSNGGHYLQAFSIFGEWKIFIDNKEATNVIAEAIGVPLTDVQTMILGVPLARIQEFE